VKDLTALIVAATVTGGLLAGCSSPTTHDLSPTTTTSSTADVVGSAYEAARVQWAGDILVAGTSDQNSALQIAVADLENGESTDSGNASRYDAAIAAIRDFESLPITGVTPELAARVNADTAEVNRFFGLHPTTGAAGCNASGPGMTSAGKAWSREPGNTSSGVLVSPLMQATTDLERGMTTDSGDRSCYPTAIADLGSMESASRSEIAESSGFMPSAAIPSTLSRATRSPTWMISSTANQRY